MSNPTRPMPLHSPGWWVMALGLMAALLGLLLLLSPPQLVVIALCLGVALLTFARPVMALVAIFGLRLFLDLWWWVDVQVFGLNPLQIFSGLVTVLAAGLVVLHRRQVVQVPGIRVFLVFLAMCCVGMLRSDDMLGSAEQMVKLTSPFLLMFVIAGLFDTDQKRHLLLGTIASIGGIIVLVSLGYLAAGQMNQVEHHGLPRLLGGFKNLHHHALVMMLLAALFTYVTTSARKGWVMVLGGALCIGALVCLMLTHVRTAVLGVVAFLLPFLWLQKRWGLLGMVLAAGVILVWTSPGLQERFLDLILFFENDPARGGRRGLGSGRWDIWSISFGAFVARPLDDLVLGLGLNGHRLVTADWARLYQTQRQFVDPHSDSLGLLYQLGPLGLLSYLTLQLRVVCTGLGRGKADRGLAHFVVGLSCCVLVANAISNAFVLRTSLGWLYWGMAGLVLAQSMRRD